MPHPAEIHGKKFKPGFIALPAGIFLLFAVFILTAAWFRSDSKQKRIEWMGDADILQISTPPPKELLAYLPEGCDPVDGVVVIRLKNNVPLDYVCGSKLDYAAFFGNMTPFDGP